MSVSCHCFPYCKHAYMFTCQCVINSFVFSILDIAEEFLKEFTIAYNTAYGVEYTKKTLKEIDAESFAEEKPAFQLLQREVSH